MITKPVGRLMLLLMALTLGATGAAAITVQRTVTLDNTLWGSSAQSFSTASSWYAGDVTVTQTPSADFRPYENSINGRNGNLVIASGGTLSITVPSTSTIVSAVITGSTSSASMELAASTGSLSSTSSGYTWTGSTSSLTLTSQTNYGGLEYDYESIVLTINDEIDLNELASVGGTGLVTYSFGDADTKLSGQSLGTNTITGGGVTLSTTTTNNSPTFDMSPTGGGLYLHINAGTTLRFRTEGYNDYLTSIVLETISGSTPDFYASVGEIDGSAWSGRSRSLTLTFNDQCDLSTILVQPQTLYEVTINSYGRGVTTYGQNTVERNMSVYTQQYEGTATLYLTPGESLELGFTPDDVRRYVREASQSVTLYDAVNDNFDFDNSDITAQAQSGSYTISNLAGDCRISVSYDLKYPMINYRAEGNGSITLSGTYLDSSDEEQNYVGDIVRNSAAVIGLAYGAKIAFTLTPDNGSRLATLTYNGNDVTDQLVNNVFTPDSLKADINVEATFAEDAHRVIIMSYGVDDTSGEIYGRTYCAQSGISDGYGQFDGAFDFSVTPGTDVTVVFAPENGCQLDSVILHRMGDTGDVVTNVLPMVANNTYVITNVNEQVALRVYYGRISTHTVTITAGAGGVVSTPTRGVREETWLETVEDGNSLPLSFLPDEGYEIDQFLVDNVDRTAEIFLDTLDNVQAYIIDNVTDDMSVSVTFAELPNEPYAVLSDSNTVLKFYYDNLKASRGGMSVGPFTYSNDREWDNSAEQIVTVVFDDTFANYSPTSTFSWFNGCRNLTSIEGIGNLKTGSVTNMGYMFYNCEHLATLDLSGFDTGEVTDMVSMFGQCSSLATLDLSSFNTAKVTNMRAMFSYCTSLTSLNLSSFNTELVTNTNAMFLMCYNLTSLDLSSFNTAQISDMGAMFSNCENLATIYAGSGWSTASVDAGAEMFTYCIALVGGMGTVYDANHTDASYAHIDGGTANPGYLTDIADVGRDNEAYAVLANNTLTFYYDRHKEQNQGMSVGPFTNAEDRAWHGSRESITTVVFDTSFANDTTLTSTQNWFYGFSNLTSVIGIANLNTANVTNMWAMFDGCSSLTTLDVTGFNTANVTEMGYLFNDCSALTSLNVTGFSTDGVTNMVGMFRNCAALSTLDLSGFNTSNVTNMWGMFAGCSGLTSLNVTGFNTENVTDMAYMFSNCSSLTSLDVTGFNTAKVTDMGYMFSRCSGLTNLDVTSFDTSAAATMEQMFTGMTSLATLDLSSFSTGGDSSSFSTGGVTNMSDMFSGDTNLTTIYVSSAWSTAALVNSPVMFDNCTSLVGGMGTVYDANHTVYTYAHIDGGRQNPGYLTDIADMGKVDEAYAVLAGDTVTFYYDKHKDDKGGVDINQTGSTQFAYHDVTTAVFDYTFANYRPTTTAFWFYDCSSLTTITGLEYLNTEEVGDMQAMFAGCTSLTALDVRGFNTSNVTNMQLMFAYCSSLTSLDVRGWNTTRVTYMTGAFSQLTSLTELDLSTFNTANLAYAGSMFESSSALTTIFVGDEWSTGSIQDGSSMFTDCTSLVGGLGTGYDANHVDVSYAHIDGGVLAPGYLTPLTNYVQVEQPVISHSGNTVTIVTPTLDATIFYTLDGTAPSAASNVYAGPFDVERNGVVKAVAMRAYYLTSETDSMNVDWFQCQPVNFVRSGYQLQLSTATPGATIYYRLSTSATADFEVYTGQLELVDDCMVTAYAALDGYNNSDETTYEFHRVEATVPTPIIAHAENVITITTTMADATIHYTLDGNDPTEQSAVYTDAFLVERNGQVKAIAARDGFYTSPVAVLDVNWFKVSDVEFEQNGNQVALSTLTPGATIFYALSTDMSAGFTQYSTPLVMAGDCTIEAYATLDGYTASDTTRFEFHADGVTVATPRITHDGNVITITTATEGATITYMLEPQLDGSLLRAIYTAPFEVDHNCIITAFAERDSYYPSQQATLVVDWFKVVAPVFTQQGNILTISTATPDATIYYRVGNEGQWSTYDQPLTLDSESIIQAYAVRNGYADSDVVTYNPTTVASEQPTAVYDGHTVTLTTAVPRTRIYYTLDGTEPTIASTLYEAPIELTGLCTVQAIAVTDGLNPSEPVRLDVDYFFDGVTAWVRGSAELSQAFEWVGGISGANRLAAIVWDADHALTDNALSDIANPNLLIFVTDQAQAPANRDNVVVNGHAENVVLTDGDVLDNMGNLVNSDFYCPMEFTAERISYTRNFQQHTQVGVSRGWETIALPFTVQYVVNERIGLIAPFGSNASDRHFWLRQMTAGGLSQATQIEANKAYVISMPNSDEYSSAFNLYGRVTFSSYDVQVPVTEPVSVSTADSLLTLVPVFQRVAQSADVYALNVGEQRGQYLEGSVFERNYRDVRPFEAYTLHGVQNPAPRYIPVADLNGGSTTGIEDVMAGYSEQTDEQWYDLNGRKLQGRPTVKGVYILNGRKTVVR